MNRDQLRPVVERRLYLHVAHEFRDAVEHVSSSEHALSQILHLRRRQRAPLAVLIERRVPRELDALRRDQRHGLGMVQAQPARESSLGQAPRGDERAQFIDLARREAHRARALTRRRRRALESGRARRRARGSAARRRVVESRTFSRPFGTRHRATRASDRAPRARDDRARTRSRDDLERCPATRTRTRTRTGAMRLNSANRTRTTV